MGANEQHPYLARFAGRFSGILRWSQLDDLWQTVRQRSDAGWYIYQIGDTPPDRPADEGALQAFIDEIDRLLRQEHEEDYCGIVYADDLQVPSFIKIFDPNNLGVVCGYSDNPPLPGWTLSTLAPVDLPLALPPTASRKRWWRRLFRQTAA